MIEGLKTFLLDWIVTSPKLEHINDLFLSFPDELEQHPEGDKCL